MELAASLQRLRLKSHKSIYELAKLSGLDPAFIGRIEAGTRGASRETVLRLGLALVHNCDAITLHDVDGLLQDAGFAPLVRV
jgi:transcriptional regulator with XRE-family HTH domain